eukprot:m.178018 g.178018  ORF g.178018 m.178018 type:complete len:58 (+) comp25353_c0_seq2:32-205(+)
MFLSVMVGTVLTDKAVSQTETSNILFLFLPVLSLSLSNAKQVLRGQSEKKPCSYNPL